MTTIATICARGGSTGIPGKNIKPLLGKPLIVWTIEQARACPSIDNVFVSTDCEDIATVARDCGADVPFIRPAELATSTAAKLPVIRHLVDHVKKSGLEITTIVDLDPTSPLRDTADIEACLDLLGPGVDVVITGYESDKSPYFNMVEPVSGGGFNLVKSLSASVGRRQDAPPVYAMNASIYVWWEKTLDSGLFGPRTKLHIMPRERSIDIDSPIDFELVELFMRKKSVP
ncbi:MAG: acylneuraminate cytidylyltransferase family protein [Rhodospirillales bacterium]